MSVEICDGDGEGGCCCCCVGGGDEEYCRDEVEVEVVDVEVERNGVGVVGLAELLRRLDGRADIHFGRGRGCAGCGGGLIGDFEGGLEICCESGWIIVGSGDGGLDSAKSSRSEVQYLHIGGVVSITPCGLLVQGGGGRGTYIPIH